MIRVSTSIYPSSFLTFEDHLLKLFLKATCLLFSLLTCETVLNSVPIFQLEVLFSTKLDNEITLHCQLISMTNCSTHFLHHVLVKLVELEHLVGERLDMGCLQKGHWSQFYHQKRIFLTLFVSRVLSLKVMAHPGTIIFFFLACINLFVSSGKKKFYTPFNLLNYLRVGTAFYFTFLCSVT